MLSTTTFIPEGIGWVFYGVDDEEEQNLIDEIPQQNKTKLLYGIISLETQRIEIYELFDDDNNDEEEKIEYVLHHFQWKNLEKLCIFHTNQIQIDFNRLIEDFFLTSIVEYHVLSCTHQDEKIIYQQVWNHVKISKKKALDRTTLWILYNCMKQFELFDLDETKFHLTFVSQVPKKTLR
jgi:hypothetical protein